MCSVQHEDTYYINSINLFRNHHEDRNSSALEKSSIMEVSTGLDWKMIPKTIIELTGCNWKQATTAIQKIRNDSAPAAASRNYDEVISAICEQVMRDREAESARIVRDREAERQRQLENQAMEESTLTITYKNWLSGFGGGRREGIATNFEKSIMPNNLRANGVPLSIWERVFVESVNFFPRVSSMMHVSGQYFDLDKTILVSNFIAKINFLLNPYGILVQVETRYEPVELKVVKQDGVFGKVYTKPPDNCDVFKVKFEPILSPDVVLSAVPVLETPPL